MSANIYNQSYNGLIKASEIITKEVQEIHKQSSQLGLSAHDLKSLKEKLEQSRESIKALGTQIKDAMSAITNQKNYSEIGFIEAAQFAVFAKQSLTIDELNLKSLQLAEKNIEQYKE